MSSKAKAKLVTLSELSANENLRTLLQGFRSPSATGKRGPLPNFIQYNPKLGLYINTHGIYLYKDGHRTWTFRAFSNWRMNTPSHFKNLVLNESEKGGVTGYVTTYDLTPQELRNLGRGRSIGITPDTIAQLDAEGRYTTNVYTSGDCIWKTKLNVAICHDYNTGESYVFTGDNPFECYGYFTYQTINFIIIDLDCVTGGGSGSGSSGSSGPGGGYGSGGAPGYGGGWGYGIGPGYGGIGGGSNNGSEPHGPHPSDPPPPAYTTPIGLGWVHFYYNLTPDQKAWLNNHPEIKLELADFIDLDLYKLGISQEEQEQRAVGFAKWTLNYLISNPDEMSSIGLILAHPFAEERGDKIDFDADFWNNYVAQQQALPSFENFNNAYPKSLNGGKMPGSQVYDLIGGQVDALADANGWINACAARVSRALNYSGVVIPHISGKTFQGDDGKYYFVGAKDLYAWMKMVFGLPDISLNASEVHQNGGQGFYQQANGQKGIYIMIPNYPAKFGASGHADVFNGSTFNSHGYFYPAGGLYSANLWVLN